MTKRVIGLLFCGGIAWAVPPIITPSTNPVVNVRGTIQFTSPDSVNWSLSPGSTGTISAGGLYTAPPSFAAKNVVAGCPALPNDHVYNTRIDNLPVDSNSTARINNISAINLGFEVSFPVNIMTNATPTKSMVFNYTSNANGLFPVIAFPYAGVENAATPNDYFAQDRHQLGVNTDTCNFYEIYNFYPVGVNGSCSLCNAQSGVKYNGMSYRLADTTGDNGGGTDAAGMFIQPLAIRYSELKSGVIKHAMRFTLSNGYIHSSQIWPATTHTNQCTTLATCFPYGSRLRLKSSFNISSYSSTTQVILKALQQYGMFLADGGATLKVQTFYDVSSDTTTWNAILSEIQNAGIDKSNFEQVDESSLMESSSSGHVNLTNAYVVPDNYANVIATRISDSVTSTVTVAIQPVTVGTKNTPYPPNSGSLSVMAGTPQLAIPYWVNGATTTAVTCTMSPTLGTLTSGCLYTAPVSKINVLSSATLTLTPTADLSQSLNFPLVIYPSDGIRINVGGKSSAGSPFPPYDTFGNYGPDAQGNLWWTDPWGSIPGWYSKDDDYYPQTSWPNSTDIGLFYTRYHGLSDQAWSMMVPNGNYTLSLGFGTSDSNAVAHSKVSLDSQGVILLSTAAVTNAAFTPNTLSYPVVVTNNQFYFAVREVLSTEFPFLNKWSLIFVTAPAPQPSGVFPSHVIGGNCVLSGKLTCQ